MCAKLACAAGQHVSPAHARLPASASGYPVAVTSALLFERDRVDEVDDWSHAVDHVGRKSILWIDVGRSDTDELGRLAELLELDAETASRLETDDGGRPYFGDFKNYLHATAYAPTNGDGDAEPAKVDCLVAKHWVVTVRDEDLEVFDEFRVRITGSSGDIGSLDGPEFLADLLAWVLEAYLAAFEAVELALEEFDERVMQRKHEDADDDEVARLVAHRKHIAGYFGVVCIVIVAIAVGTLAFARLRRWSSRMPRSAVWQPRVSGTETSWSQPR